jgi:hypothetical protein
VVIKTGQEFIPTVLTKLLVCAVGARMVRRLLLNKEPTQKSRSGRIW